MSIARVTLIAVASNAVSLAVAQLALVWLAGQSLVHVESSAHGVLALSIALLAGGAVAAGVLTNAGRSVGARIAAATLALGIVVGLVWLLASHLRVGDVLMLAPGLVVTLLLAARPPASVVLGRGERALAIVLSIAGVLAWSHAALRDTIVEYREQRLPSFTMELVAAYPYDLSPELPAIVVDRHGEIGDVVSIEGSDFNLHRVNSLRLVSSDVRRVRWISDGAAAIIAIRLDEEARDAFRARARARSSQLDALLIDGEPRLLLSHDGPFDDRIVISSGDRRALWGAYQRLTRAE